MILQPTTNTAMNELHNQRAAVYNFKLNLAKIYLQTQNEFKG